MITEEYFESFAGGLIERRPHFPVADSVFVLAAGGLRRLRGRGEGFLGYSAREIFWRDVLELVHEEDILYAETLVSEAVKRPGSSVSFGLRVLDATGSWRLVDFSVRNLLEAPGDTGLVVADLRDAHPDDGYGRPYDAGY